MRGIITQLITGLEQGAAYALLALGLTLIFGTLGVVNFAHGALFMLGALVLVGVFNFFGKATIRDINAEPSTTAWGTQEFPLVTPAEWYLGPEAAAMLAPHTLWIAIVLSILALALVAFVMERGLIKHFYRRSHAEQILVTFGLAVVLGELVRAFVGASQIPLGEARPELLAGRISPFGFTIEVYKLFFVVASLVIVAVVICLMRFTRFGMIIRSGMQDRQMVGLLGVNIQMRFTLMFILGAVIAGMAGAMYGPIIAFSSDWGMTYLVIAFIVVVVGGMGSISGAVIIGFALGVLKAMAGLPAIQAIVPGLSNIIIYLTAVVILLVMPRGLMGRRGVMEE